MKWQPKDGLLIDSFKRMLGWGWSSACGDDCDHDWDCWGSCPRCSYHDRICKARKVIDVLISMSYLSSETYADIVYDCLSSSTSSLLAFLTSANGLMVANTALSKVAVGYCNIATMMTDILGTLIMDMDGNIK